jgi:hypothetical protein
VWTSQFKRRVHYFAKLMEPSSCHGSVAFFMRGSSLGQLQDHICKHEMRNRNVERDRDSAKRPGQATLQRGQPDRALNHVLRFPRHPNAYSRRSFRPRYAFGGMRSVAYIQRARFHTQRAVCFSLDQAIKRSAHFCARQRVHHSCPSLARPPARVHRAGAQASRGPTAVRNTQVSAIARGASYAMIAAAQ